MTNSVEIVSLVDFNSFYPTTTKIGGSDDSPEAQADYENFLSPRIALHLHDTAKYMHNEYIGLGNNGKALIMDYLPENVQNKPKAFIDSLAEKFLLHANNLASGEGIVLNCIADEVALTIIYLEAKEALTEYGSLEEVLSYYDEVPVKDERDENFSILLEHYLENFDATLLGHESNEEEELMHYDETHPEMWFLPY